MKNKIINIGGIILFYSIIVVGVLLLNSRFKTINQIQEKENSYYLAMNK